MSEQKFYLVRSPYELLSKNQAGYGWPQVNFSKEASVESLLNQFKEKSLDIGRQRNQIKRFFSIKKGDLVVVPLPRAIAIGYATGERFYETGVDYGENRIGIEFLRNEDGSLLRIQRKKLKEGFEARLKIRMTIVSLADFKDDILNIVEKSKTGGAFNFDSKLIELETNALNNIKIQLLNNICGGNTYLESGGYGLEKLVAELLKIEGYTAKIQSKAEHQGVADVDIVAESTKKFTSKLIIQVKHHSGKTGAHALAQLEALENLNEQNEDVNIQKWVITSANVSDKFKERAENSGINIMEGEELVEWIIENTSKLSQATLNRLGLSTIPTLLM